MAITRRLTLAVALIGILFQGCNKETLSIQISELVINPLLTEGQTSIADPVGIQLGDIPLFGYAKATFELSNPAIGTLRIDSTTIKSSTGGTFTIIQAPTELKTQEKANLIIQFSPHEDDEEGIAVIELVTNAGENLNAVYQIKISGTGFFVGEPQLIISYGGLSFPVDGQCTPNNNGINECVLSPFDFGFIPIGQNSTLPLKLRNIPAEGTCRLPDLPTGEPDCTPACVITFNQNPAGWNTGLGFTPPDAGFSFIGAAPLPFKLAPAASNCPAQDEELNLIRGEVSLLVNFEGGEQEADHTAQIYVESNAPNAQQIEIPVLAKVREAPIAVAKIRTCDSTSLSDCSDPENLEPLMRVYFDGTDSYDPNGGTINAYSWEVIEYPEGTDTAMFLPSGTTTEYFSFMMPLAGTYKVKLTVTNNLGVPSAETETSFVEFTAKPDSRLHIQVVWDSPIADLDLHLVLADQSPTGREVYHEKWDCYWQACRPGCENNTASPCDEPTKWFNVNTNGDPIEAFEGPNPRLDIDDTNGFGPENINIDEPQGGKYHIYVHYYAIGDGDEMAPTYTTIRIYGDGQLKGEFQRALDKNSLWAVGAVEWENGTTVVTPAQSDGDGVSGSVVILPYLPPNGEGFLFPGNVFN